MHNIMEQVIYTYGGGEVLWKVFNALAMIFKSDNSYMTTMVRLTLAIGALWAAYTAMVKGSIMALVHNWALPIFLLLSLFLIPFQHSVRPACFLGFVGSLSVNKSEDPLTIWQVLA